MIYDIRTYGAVPDGTTLNTAAIQSAIDACGAAGGGTVLISGGTYLTGTVELRTGVELHIDAAARLLGSPDCADYPEKDRRHVDRRKLPRHQSASLIFAEECERIAITGRGTIDANGDSFIERVPDGGREATHIENLSFDHIMMDRGYSYPIYIHIDGDPRTQVDCIRNLHFSRIHARAHQMPRIVGRPGCPVTDLTFSDCSFTRLPAPADDHQSHGATMRRADVAYATVELQYARGIRFRDTEFTLEDGNA